METSKYVPKTLYPYDLSTVSCKVKLTWAIPQLSDNPSQPPMGYVFVPKGDVYVTRNWYENLILGRAILV